MVIEGGETIGHTLYFGSPSSDIQIRFYEKKKNVQMELDIDVWNRTEVQLRDLRAYVVAQVIADDVLPLGEIVAGILRNYIQFRIRKATDKK
nr:replication initiation factor domain-containing protein [Anoxybacillus sp. KU2-6(11)]